MADQRCPDCGNRMGNGYNPGDQCHECWYLDRLVEEILNEKDPNKIKARIREEYGNHYG